MALPNVFSYLEYRVFLGDWLREKKRSDPAFSYSTFATLGGCSRSAVANVLSGARSPRPETLDAFARAMELSPHERNFLGLLVEFDAAKEKSAQHEVMGKLVSERFSRLRKAESHPDSDLYRYLEHWFVPVVFEMAHSPSFQCDPEWIAERTRPRITVPEARAALDTLFALELLEGRGEQVVPAELRFETDVESHQSATTHFHRNVVSGRLRSINTKNAKNQHLVAATFSIRSGGLEEAKALLHQVAEKVANLGDMPGSGPRRVYQLSVQLLPATDEL